MHTYLTDGSLAVFIYSTPFTEETHEEGGNDVMTTVHACAAEHSVKYMTRRKRKVGVKVVCQYPFYPNE